MYLGKTWTEGSWKYYENGSNNVTADFQNSDGDVIITVYP